MGLPSWKWFKDGDLGYLLEEQEGREQSSSAFPCSSWELIFITSTVPALPLCLGSQLGSRSVSSFQQMPMGFVTSGSEIEDGVPETDQELVLASSSPPPGRRAEKLEQPALICP